MAEFKWFRNVNTGKVDYLPVHVGELFYDSMVEVDSNDASCVDCTVHTEDETDLELDDFEFEDKELVTPDPVVNTLHKNKDK